jgi:hypothetical protein
MTDRLSVAEWAAKQGISRQSAYDAIQRCGIPLVDGKVDALVASTLYRARTRPRMPNAGKSAPTAGTPPTSSASPDRGEGAYSSPPAGAESYERSRARREAAEADQSELRAKQMAGELVDRATAATAVYDAFQILRDRCLNACPALAQRVAGVHDVAQIERELLNAVRDALGMAEQVQAAIDARLAARGAA